MLSRHLALVHNPGRILQSADRRGFSSVALPHCLMKNSVLAHIQDLEDRVISRFCSVARRLHRKMEWFEDTTPYDTLEPLIREEVVFYEARGFYLFQEPWLEHEPFNRRFRVVLTFRPTESNR